MQMMKLGKSDIQVSRICFGAFGIGGGTTWGDCDDSTSIDTINMAIDHGINYIDTAPVYGLGHSEEVIAKAIKGKRDKVILQSKCSLNWREKSDILEYTRNGKSVYRDLSAKAIKKDLEDCLQRLGTDYLDILVVHRQSRGAVPVAETMGALMDLKKEGKIKGVGISNASPDILTEYLKVGPVELVQEEYSLLNEHAHHDYIARCNDNGVTLQSFSTLGRGILTGTVTLETTYPEGDARRNFNWFQPNNRGHILEVLKKWEPICQKYGCSMSNLVFAWTFNSLPSINIVCGLRRPSTLLDTVAIDSFDWDTEDFEIMNKDINVLHDKLTLDLNANR